MKSKVKIIILTGNLGSGKSTVGKIFEKLGAKLIDSDILAREVVEPNSEGLAKIKKTFGSEFLLSTGELDRKKLGQLVFTDKKKLATLESILHPLIRERHKEIIKEYLKERESPLLVVCIIPLYFEKGSVYTEIDAVIVVSAAKEISIERVLLRDGCSKDFAEKKYAMQFPIEEKEKKADFIIQNSSNIKKLESEVFEIYKKLMN
ncbi:MAG: dephospho-CoA kinase [bacterium]|nr:dephospho-CoA kinase [bacterium]